MELIETCSLLTQQELSSSTVEWCNKPADHSSHNSAMFIHCWGMRWVVVRYALHFTSENILHWFLGITLLALSCLAVSDWTVLTVYTNNENQFYDGLIEAGCLKNAESFFQPTVKQFGTTLIFSWLVERIRGQSFCSRSGVKKIRLHPPLTVAYAENFLGGFSHSGVWWSFVFGVPCLWRHNLTSYSCFQTNVFAKFVDTICMFFYTHSP